MYENMAMVMAILIMVAMDVCVAMVDRMQPQHASLQRAQGSGLNAGSAMDGSRQAAAHSTVGRNSSRHTHTRSRQSC